MSNNKSNKAIWTVVITALASSSCCIAPAISLLAGLGGYSASITWLNPLRPYLIVFTILVLIYVWYTHLKNKKQDNCGCSVEKPSFFNSKGFLIGMTIFALLSISFPYLLPSSNTEVVELKNQKNTKTITIFIEGMTCAACENHITESVKHINGVVGVNTSYKNSLTTVSFDTLQSDISEIIKAINLTGYKPKHYEKQN